jgi:serine/threonine protein phosphatase PrpC
MDNFRISLKTLLESKGFTISQKELKIFDDFCELDFIKQSIELIKNKQDEMLELWKNKTRINDFLMSQIIIPNATVGKPYFFQFDKSNEQFKNIKIISVNFKEQDFPLQFNSEKNEIESTFNEAGQFTIEVKFNLQSEDDENKSYVKELKLFVNPDPKSLWKNLDSDRNDPYWKEDNVSSSGILGSKKLIVGSKRGRSHAHEGIFRDDEFGFNFTDQNEWGIIVVADGAGSAKYSRKGSLLACEQVVEYFKNIAQEDIDKLTEAIISEIKESNELNQKTISSFCISHLGKAAFQALNAIKEEATNKGAQIKDYSTTLIFAFVKEFEDQLFVSSFWVGDGGIGIFSKESNTVILLGTPDSGEFSGQTRFLTMSEIFADNAYISRIKYRIVDKSCKLVLMTDGITDAKFQTDAALDNIDIWNTFINDLGGQNEDNIKINFDEDDIKVSEDNLMKWMDFWSPGNHDDRTIAIFF